MGVNRLEGEMERAFSKKRERLLRDKNVDIDFEE